MQNGNKTQNLFNEIAKKYDFLNNIISFGTHKIVKNQAIKNLDIFDNAKILDICTGTGDLAAGIKKICPETDVTGIDFSEKMLEIAHKRTKDVDFLQGDAENLPFEDNKFDIVTMGFGLRNIENRGRALKEIYRVLKPNGEFMHLDFGKGLNLPDTFFDKMTPPLVEFFLGKKMHYEYLIKSKKEFPSPEESIEYFESFGFKYKCRKDYIFGIISAQIMTK